MKKNLLVLALFLLFALSSLLSLAQSSPEKKTIATLGPGESLVHGESCFRLDADPASISFVTVEGSGTSKQYYCYGKDGEKTGPVKEPDESYWAACKDIDVEDCIPNDDPKQGDLQESIDWTSGAVKFQGKTYGPYGQIMMFFLSQDDQNFYAVALSEEMKLIFFDKNNRKIELAGMPDEIIISPDGQNAYAKVKGSINPFDPEAVQKMMDNPEEMNNPKINLVGIDGSKYGPYVSNAYSDAWFIPSGQLVVYNNSEISLNGKLLFKSEDFISPCDIWISSNGKDYAYANYENLVFSDGTKFVAPLVINYVQITGKGFLKWIALEDKKNLVFYKKAF
jgi:hypothetical protein